MSDLAHAIGPGGEPPRGFFWFTGPHHPDNARTTHLVPVGGRRTLCGSTDATDRLDTVLVVAGAHRDAEVCDDCRRRFDQGTKDYLDIPDPYDHWDDWANETPSPARCVPVAHGETCHLPADVIAWHLPSHTHRVEELSSPLCRQHAARYSRAAVDGRFEVVARKAPDGRWARSATAG